MLSISAHIKFGQRGPYNHLMLPISSYIKFGQRGPNNEIHLVYLSLSELYHAIRAGNCRDLNLFSSKWIGKRHHTPPVRKQFFGYLVMKYWKTHFDGQHKCHLSIYKIKYILPMVEIFLQN